MSICRVQITYSDAAVQEKKKKQMQTNNPQQIIFKQLETVIYIVSAHMIISMYRCI